MKIKSGLVLHSLGEEHVVVPVEERAEKFHGMVRLNGTGTFLWEQMQQEFTRESLVASLRAGYDLGEQEAREAVNPFLDKLIAAGLIEV